MPHRPHSRARSRSAALVASAAFVALGFAPASSASPSASRPGADPAAQPAAAAAATGPVIFIHPDGTGSPAWAAARALAVGPDGDLAWDRLPHLALYRGHLLDSLTGTSNGGGTVHAYGVKVASDAYGRTAGGDRGEDIVDAEGRSRSVAKRAIAAGIPVGLVQTGTQTEPGTGCFLASAPSRYDHASIAAQLVESGAAVLLGGGERWFLPEGEAGVHGEGRRTDGRNLIDEAAARGYVVVRTRAALLDLPPGTTRVLGLFASNHTFNAATEAELRERGLPRWVPGAPTVAEMTDVALRVLQAAAGEDERFLLVIEEEATDNFGNQNHATGMLEAMLRADAAIARVRSFLAEAPRALAIVAADSDAGGMRLQGLVTAEGAAIPDALPERDANGAPIDGVDGAGTAPFLAAPDARGRRLPFRIHWAARDDVTGGVLVRAEGGPLASRVRGSMDATEITELMALALFGAPLPEPVVAARLEATPDEAAGN